MESLKPTNFMKNIILLILLAISITSCNAYYPISYSSPQVSNLPLGIKNGSYTILKPNVPFSIFDKSTKLSTPDFIKRVTLLSNLIYKFENRNQNLILCIYNRSVNNIIIPFSIWKSKNIYLPVSTDIPLKKLLSIIDEHNFRVSTN